VADAMALIEQAYADFARGDVPAVLAVLADDVQWFEAEGHPWWPGGAFVGHRAVVENVFARIAAEYDGLTIHVERFVGAGETVLVQARYRGRAKATGKDVDAQAAHVWDVRDGKVVRFQQYVDTAQLQAALGG
jgi:ketosteroid isomerase-like protein